MKLIEELDTSTKKDIIIEGLMRSKGVYLLVSKPKVGKSMLALQLSYCLTNGLPFLGHKVIPSPVLYISTESDFGQLQDRYKTLGLIPKKDSLFIIDRDGKPNISILDHEEEIDDFSGDKTANKLVIIDMLKDMDLGISYDINDFQDVAQKLMPKLRELCEKYNLTIYDNIVIGQATIKPTLRYGSRGTDVQFLQQMLALNGYNAGVVDGIFGAKTLNAVKMLQLKNGLSVDGIVGQKTWAVLTV